MERRRRLEEWIAALMTERLTAGPTDNAPRPLAFLTRAVLDAAFNAWYDHETKDVAGLVDDLVRGLRATVLAAPAPGARQSSAARTRTGSKAHR
jgi:hypothetical protein